MFIVHREDTAEMQTAVFGGHQSWYTKQVASAPNMPIWIINLQTRTLPEWEPPETRYVASFKVQDWLDQFTDARVEHIALLAPRDGELILAICSKVVEQEHADGMRSLCFLVDEGKVTVCDEAPPLDVIVGRKTAWQRATARR